LLTFCVGIWQEFRTLTTSGYAERTTLEGQKLERMENWGLGFGNGGAAGPENFAAGVDDDDKDDH